jgi:pimeloyl-ACP methyl ester carboxylesterase
VADDEEGTTTSSGEDMLWEPYGDGDIDALKLTASGSSVNSIYAKIGDVLSEAYVSFAGLNIYKSFIADMNDFVATGTAREWLPVAYDWRLSLDQLLATGAVSSDGDISYLDSTSSPYIIQEFYRLARESKTGRVSIVAHSNGGLVAKALAIYLEGRGDADLIDKMVFVAVPQTGTPHAVGALLHGFGEWIPLLASAKAMRRLGQNMPGAYNLLPSAWYVALDSRPIVSFSATTSSSSLYQLYAAYGSSPSSFSSLLDFLTGAEGRKSPTYADLSLPETLNKRLLDKAVLAHETLDAWTPSPSSEVFQVAGRGIDTVSSIEYFEGRKAKKPVLLYKPRFTSDGDGTVMTESAWALRDTDNVSKYWVDLKLAGKGLSRNRDHSDILEVDGLRSFILEVLSEDPHDIRHRADVPSVATLLQKDVQKKTRVIVYSPDVLVHAWDNEGNHTGISSSTGLVEINVPGSDYREFGDVISVVLPPTGSQVTISGSSMSVSTSTPTDNGPVTIDVDEVVSDEVATSSSYGDINLPVGSVIIVDVTSASTSQGSTTTIPIVSIDEDGDGTADHELIPDGPNRPGVPEEDADGDGVEHAPVVLGVSESIESSRLGGRRREGQSPVSLNDMVSTTSALAPFETEDIVMVVTPIIPNPGEIVGTSIKAASSPVVPAIDTVQASTLEGPQSVAAAYVAVGQAGRHDRPGLSIMVVPIGIALLLALAILWFLSCKISKSR